jgi:tRNA G18 (ribose-2'-O)-methylase SpoU
MTDTRNIKDKFKGWQTDVIRDDVQSSAFDYACLMINLTGDFNMASVFRNGNAFGCKELFYFGRRRWDKRGAVGTHHYSKITHLASEEDIIALKDQYTFVGLECGIDNCVMMNDYDWSTQKPILLIVGAEGAGLPENIIELCDKLVEIPMYGSVRSINVATATGIAMCDIVSKRFQDDK